MKSLKDFIKDCIFENTDDSIPKFWKRTKENAQELSSMYDKLRDISKKFNKISLGNQASVRKLFNAFVQSLPFGDKTRNLDKLATYGIKDEISFKKMLLQSYDELKKYQIGTDWIRDFDLSALEADYQKAKRDGTLPKEVDDKDYEERNLVIYYRYDPEIHQAYEFIGKRGKATNHQENMIKMRFHYDYNIRYVDCYPILAKNYYGNENKLKKRTVMDVFYDDNHE